MIVAYSLGEVVGYNRFVVRSYMGGIDRLGLVRSTGGERSSAKEGRIADRHPGVSGNVALQWIGSCGQKHHGRITGRKEGGTLKCRMLQAQDWTGLGWT